MNENDHEHGHEPKKYIFFVNGSKYETDQSELTVAQIKARVPNVEPGDKLSLEGHGDEPDQILQDDQLIPLAKDKGPLRFTIVPSASFG
jgi:hypothetical protein